MKNSSWTLDLGREGGVGEMPKGVDWRNQPPANLRTGQSKVGVALWLNLLRERRIQDYTGCPKKVITGDWARAPWLQQHYYSHFLGHPVYIVTFSSPHRLNKLLAACSDIRVNKEMRSIEVNKERTNFQKKRPWITMKASDCVNGTWLEDLGVTDYNTITKKYLQHRSTTIVPVLFNCH